MNAIAERILQALDCADVVIIAGSPMLTNWAVDIPPSPHLPSDEACQFSWYDETGTAFVETLTVEDLETAVIDLNVVTFNRDDPDEAFNLELYLLAPLEVYA